MKGEDEGAGRGKAGFEANLPGILNLWRMSL
jgi:hypothetical protein